MLLALACGGPSPTAQTPEPATPDDTGSDGTGPDGTGSETSAGESDAFRCPGTYAEAAALRPDCANATEAHRCDYEVGDCWCGEEPQCSGAYPQPTPAMWICERVDAPREPCPDYP